MNRMIYEVKHASNGFQILMKVILVIVLGLLTVSLFVPRSGFFFRKPIYKPIFGGLNSYDVVLCVGETYHLYVFGINKRVSFQSSDFKVATVNMIGTVKAWQPGTSIIKVRFDQKVIKCRIRVVKLNKEKLNMKIGQTKRLFVKYAFWRVSYHSSNNGVISVNRFGTVKAVGKGKASVTVTYRGKKMSCIVYVK